MPNTFSKQFLLEGAIHYHESLNNQRKGDLNIPSLLHATEIYYYLRRVALLNQLPFTTTSDQTQYCSRNQAPAGRDVGA
jgi:hypothetical protein